MMYRFALLYLNGAVILKVVLLFKITEACKISAAVKLCPAVTNVYFFLTQKSLYKINAEIYKLINC